MKVELFSVRRRFGELRDQIMAALARVCCRSASVLGEDARALEAEFAEHCEGRTAVAVNSTTSGLHLSLLALGVGPGHEVITTPLTSVATCEAITYTGATPVFADVDPNTGTLDPAGLDKVLTERTKVVVPVHWHGLPADLAPIYRFAVAHDLEVVENASQAHGATYRGWRIGSVGILTVFGLGPEANLGAYGSGGIVVVNDDGLAETLRVLRDHGRSGPQRHERIGYSYAMDELEAAVLRVKLRHMGRWATRRRELAERYYEGLKGCPVRMLVPPPQCEGGWCVLTIVTPDRDALGEHLTRREVASEPACPVPVHLQPAFAPLGYQPGHLPAAERLARQALLLPLYPELRDIELTYVVGCVREHFGESAAVATADDMPSRMVANSRFGRIGDVIRAFWTPRARPALGSSRLP